MENSGADLCVLDHYKHTLQYFTVGIEAARVQAGFMVSFNKTVIAKCYIHTYINFISVSMYLADIS